MARAAGASAPREGAQALLLAASAVVLIAGVRLAAPFLVPFLLASFLAVATNPLVDRLHRLRLPRALAVLAGVLTDLAVLSGLAALLGRSLQRLTGRLPLYEQRLTALVGELAAWLSQHGLDVSVQTLREQLDPASVMKGLTALLQGTAGVVSQVFVVLVIVAFMLLEAPRLRAKLGAVGRPASQATASGVRTYLLVKTGTSLATGLLAGGLCASAGVGLPLLMGLLAYLLNYIPTIGSFIAAVPAVIVALVELGPGWALGIAVGYFVINTAIGALLEPRLMGQAMGLSPLVVFLSMLFWGLLLGPVGALLSAPLTMIARDWLLGTRDLGWIGEWLSDEA